MDLTKFKHRSFKGGQIIVINADCLEVMHEIGSKKIDLILTDPPYGTTACAWDKKVNFWNLAKKITKLDRAMIFSASQPFSSELVVSNKKEFSHSWIWKKNSVGNSLLANSMPLKNFEEILVFIKKEEINNNDPRREIMKEIARKYGKNRIFSLFENEGRYSSKYSARTHAAFKFGFFGGARFDLMDEKLFKYLKEFIDFGFEYDFFKRKTTRLKSSDKRIYNPQGVKSENKIEKVGKKPKHIGERPNQQGKSYFKTKSNYPKAIIEFKKDSNSIHPTQKPIALFEYLIKTYSNENDLIFDGFLGSGTTAISCIRTNRRLIGCELDPIYFEKMCQRIEEELRQDTLF